MSKKAEHFPTMQEIERLILKAKTTMSFDQIADTLRLEDGQARQKLSRKLNTLLDQERIVEDSEGFKAAPLGDSGAGTVNWEKGDMVVYPLDGSPKLIVRNPPPDQLLPKDVVRYEVTNSSVKPALGHITEVIEKPEHKIVGLFRQAERFQWMRPLYRPFNKWDVRLTKLPKDTALHEGDMIVVRLNRKSTHMGELIGECVTVLGDPDAPGIDIEGAIHQFDLPDAFSKSTIKQCEKYSSEIPKSSIQGREDLRKVPFVTIDGEDARDFDDAVWCEPLPDGGWHLRVAIADVAHYVKPGTALDKDAIERGTSVYFPGHVVPMLPEILSNDLCSLKPNIDRLAMVCDMIISKQGKITKSTFYEGVIRSHMRLTYQLVQDYLDGHKMAREKLQPVSTNIEGLHQLFKALLKARHKRGAIDFDSTEPVIMFSQDGQVQSIETRHRVNAHRIIEECMLCANVCAAATLQEHKLPVPFRVHAEPPEDKIRELKQSLEWMGIQFPPSKAKKILPRHYVDLLHQTADRPDAEFIQTLVLRSMSQAIYSTENVGHFGLAYKAYLHFTSPIRRYPDLVVHRALKVLLHDGPKGVEQWQGRQEDVAKVALHASMAERRADEASRDVVKALKCRYILNHCGVETVGTIVGVTHFGMFIELDDLHVDGLVHIAEIGNEYFSHDPIRHQLIGESSGSTYTLGDKVMVKILEASIEERKVDFKLLRAMNPKKTKKKSFSKSTRSTKRQRK
jgi:ribonuclease R